VTDFSEIKQSPGDPEQGKEERGIREGEPEYQSDADNLVG
tara:strand:- start:49 stop:168 length:120 start_codon:yes stop_codon:yes gene_type:complete